MRARIAIFAVLLFCLCPTAPADEGRIPLFEPTTIAAPGHYVLTRNIVASGTVFTIPFAAANVTIDLNGFILWSASPTDPIIDVVRGANPTDWPNVFISNGDLVGGSTAIDGGGRVHLDGVRISGQAGAGVLLVDSFTLVMRKCVVSNTGAQGVLYYGTNGGEIVDSQFADNLGTAIEILPNLKGMLISGNRIDYAFKNGISLSGSNNRLSRNIVINTRETSPGVDGDGIHVQGSHNVLEDNQVTDNRGHGLVFAGSGPNIYRGNVLTGNTAGALVDSGTVSSIDAGGNVP